MPRKSKFAGILQPRQVGRGAPEISVLVMYDVESDRIRAHLADLCLNYALARIQFSAFMGSINRNRRQELALRIQALIGDESARVRIIPLFEDSMRDSWTLDQYRRDADELAAKTEKSEAAPLPVLKIIRVEDC
ncbi:MAG: CRISPR-associated endonuclease Cas2 [Acidobacteria bacterium]|nr:CRISPR-associated endonuclease Cas2 [Acidobacteriota bacterium]